MLNVIRTLRSQIWRPFIRRIATSCNDGDQNGLVLGMFIEDDDPKGETIDFTKWGHLFDRSIGTKLKQLIKLSGKVPKLGDVKVFFGLTPDYPAVAIVGLGTSCLSYNETEQMDEYKEAVRIAAAVGCRALQENQIRTIFVESFNHAESAAEGAALGVWVYQELKNCSDHKTVPRLEMYEDCDHTGWQIGLQKAAAQNLTRQLCETPANLLTPLAFAQCAVEVLCKAGVNVEVKVRNWAKIFGMEAFLAAAKGSCEPPIFLEVSYYGCEYDVAPVVLVGKGVTFDSGGLCLKSCSELKHMRGDMAGAAVVVAVCRAVAALQLPINVRGLIPLCENLPGTCAMKPGDIIRAKNGKTILVEDTDFDGRMCMADALTHAAMYNPKFICDIGTLCRELVEGLGPTACAVFSNNDCLWEQLRVASVHTGDRVWRLPLWHHFKQKIKRVSNADVGEEFRSSGAPCSAAAFLREFIHDVDWIHLDTYNVNLSDGCSIPYIRSGMSGRPTRTVVEFLAQLACQPPPICPEDS